MVDGDPCFLTLSGMGEGTFFVERVGEGAGENRRGFGTGELSPTSRDCIFLTASRTLCMFCLATSSGERLRPFCSFSAIFVFLGCERGRFGGSKRVN